MDRAFPIQRGADGIHDPPDDGLPDRHFRDAAGALDGVAFFDILIRAKNDRTHIVLFKVQRNAFDAAGELQQLAGHGIIQAVNLGDAVADLQDRPDFGHIHLLLERLNLVADD